MSLLGRLASARIYKVGKMAEGVRNHFRNIANVGRSEYFYRLQFTVRRKTCQAKCAPRLRIYSRVFQDELKRPLTFVPSWQVSRITESTVLGGPLCCQGASCHRLLSKASTIRIKQTSFSFRRGDAVRNRRGKTAKHRLITTTVGLRPENGCLSCPSEKREINTK